MNRPIDRKVLSVQKFVYHLPGEPPAGPIANLVCGQPDESIVFTICDECGRTGPCVLRSISGRDSWQCDRCLRSLIHHLGWRHPRPVCGCGRPATIFWKPVKKYYCQSCYRYLPVGALGDPDGCIDCRFRSPGCRRCYNPIPVPESFQSVPVKRAKMVRWFDRAGKGNTGSIEAFRKERKNSKCPPKKKKDPRSDTSAFRRENRR